MICIKRCFLFFRSGFFFFCNEFRGGIKQENPEFGIGDIAKALGKKWEKQTNRTKYETLAKKDKERYEKVCIYFILFFQISPFLSRE